MITSASARAVVCFVFLNSFASNAACSAAQPMNPP